MPRSQLNEIVALSTVGTPVDNASITVTKRDGSGATVWTDSSSAVAIPQPLSSVDGQIRGWLDDGSYVLQVTSGSSGVTFAPDTVYVEAINGDAYVLDRVSKGQPGGYATLDNTGKIPAGQLPPLTGDATSSQKGILQLAGDLAGTAAAPSVPGLATKESTTNKGAANGYAPLGADSKVPSANLPASSSRLQDLSDVNAASRGDREVAVWLGDNTTGKLTFRPGGDFWIDDFVPAGASLDRTGVTSGNPVGTNRAALNNAVIAAQAAGGGRVRLGGGIFDFTAANTVPSASRSHAIDLLTGNTGMVSVEGEGQNATLVKQTATTWGFAHLDPNYVAGNTTTLQNWALRKLTIDHQNVTNGFKGGALLDCSGRLNLGGRIIVEDIDLLNMGTPKATGNQACILISMNTQAGQINDSTRYTATGAIELRRLNMGAVGGGGNTGVSIGGFVNDPSGQKVVSRLYKTPMVANTLFAGNITCEDVYWDCGSDPTQFNIASGFQFGGDGFTTGKIRMRRCTARRSNDVNLEIDSAMDFHAEDCTFADAWSEDIFVATWGGGGNATDGWLADGVNRFTRCNLQRTASGAAATTSGLGMSVAICAKGGIQPPSVEFNSTTFERVGAEGSKLGSTPVILTSAPRTVTFKDTKIIDRAPTDSIATTQQNRPLIGIQAAGGKTHLLIDGFHWERVDDQVNATAINSIRQWWGINVAAGTDLTFDIKNVTERFNVASYTGSANPSVKTRMVSGNMANGTGAGTQANGIYAETFGNVATLPNNWDLIVGPGHTTVGGNNGPGATSVTQESLYRWISAADLVYYDEVIGLAMDATLQAEFTPGAALASGGVGVLCEITVKETSDGLNKLIAAVGADSTGANPFLRWDKVIAGVRSTIQTQALSAGVLAAATKLTLRAGITGNVVTADCFAGTNTTFPATATDHLSLTLDTATATVLGDNILGYSGVGAIPADAAFVWSKARYWRRSVMRGVFHSIHPKRSQNVAEALGLYITWLPATHRIVNEVALERSSFLGLVGATTTQELKIDDATIATQVRARANSTVAAWASNITPGASPYTYTNGDLTDEIVTITGGTVSSIQVSRDGGVTFITIASATGAEVRLRHGDQVKVTYTVAPTITKVRA
jgi:hypothetical protein